MTSLCLFSSANILFGASLSNTASLSFTNPDSINQTISSNSVTSVILPSPTQGTILFYNYSSAATTQSESLKIDGGRCLRAGNFVNLPAPSTYTGSSIGTITPIQAEVASSYHLGEPMIVKVEDANRNIDPLVRDTVLVDLSASSGDRESIRLLETGENTGVFATAIQTKASPPAMGTYDCVMTIEIDSRVTASYTDPYFPSDTASANILVDPYGIVFNTSDGQPVNGVTVRLVNAITGLDANVFADDGVTPYPSSMVTGSTIVVGAQTYDMPDGGFRFPLIAPGTYRLEVEGLASNMSFPTTFSVTVLETIRDPNGNPYSLTSGYDGNNFVVGAGPALNIDLPVDTLSTQLVLAKSASKSEVSHGDFIRYELSLRNIGVLNATNSRLEDLLPLGFKYKQGSLHVNGVKSADPEISSSGREMNISLGNVLAGQEKIISYVVEVTSGASVGKATNQAQAKSDTFDSNLAQHTLKVKHAFFASHSILVGEVVQLIKDQKAKGLANVKVMMEDGSYVLTDKNGRYHFEGVKPGTHVVQVDQTTLPKNFKIEACANNTRHAHQPHSQFVDLSPGALWRVDFCSRELSPDSEALKYSFSAEADRVEKEAVAELVYTLDLEAIKTLQKLQFSIKAPAGYRFVTESALLDANPIPVELKTDELSFLIDQLDEAKKSKFEIRVLPSEKLNLAQCREKKVKTKISASYELLGASEKGIQETEHAACALPNDEISKPTIQFEDKYNLEPSESEMSLYVGEGVDWLKDASEGVDFLFPSETYNPRSPATRIVLKHFRDDKIDISINGNAVNPVLFSGRMRHTQLNIVASEWKGVTLKEGANLIQVSVTHSSGEVTQLSRTIHYSNTPSRFEFVPEKSRLVANGIEKPIIVVRVLDRDGKPVRKGLRGNFSLNDPYVPDAFDEFAQKRQLSALDRFDPEFVVQSNDGLAAIELRPTTEAGELLVKFNLGKGKNQEMKIWLEPEARDWVVVGFAEGTTAYKTLKSQMKDLPESEKNNQIQTDAQTKLYAKGRVTGNWIMTVAFDSQKEKSLKPESFKGVVSPNEFYTLYADETTSRQDAPSSEKLYLKIEKSKFYALFGDFDTGLTDTTLGRYNRSYTGVKSEYSGTNVGFKVFGVEEDTFYNKEEVQGRGESFLFRLARAPLVINSEKIRIQVRDRYRSEKIIREERLSRHIDYLVDYRAGTIQFKKIISATDSDSNPQFIVLEYETESAAKSDISFGGRVEVKTTSENLKAGLTHINESKEEDTSTLNSIDLSYKITPESQLKLETAQSYNPTLPEDKTANAYLAEFEHTGKVFDWTSYVQDNESNFGIGHEAQSERGTFKTGAAGKYRLSDQWELSSTYDHQNQKQSDNRRDVASLSTRYNKFASAVDFGYQFINESLTTEQNQAHQLTLGVSHNFYKSKFEIEARVEENLGPKDSWSEDYPNRYLAKLSYNLNQESTLFTSQEFTSGKTFNSSLTRAGVETRVWEGGRLTQAMNQQISEAGSRSYSTMGLAQGYRFNEKWSFDGSLDVSETFRNTPSSSPFNPSHPYSAGSYLGNNSFSEDYFSLVAGLTYGTGPWAWNIRGEGRVADQEDKYGVATKIIRELDEGVTLSSGLEYYMSDYNSSNTQGRLFQGDLSLALRPPESRWTLLNKLKYRFESVDNEGGLPVFGQTSLKGVSDAESNAVINNFNLNFLSSRRKEQYSLFYGAKYVWDKYDNTLYRSFTDMWAVELRHDITEYMDIGAQAAILHSWTSHNMKYSFGPSFGVSPLKNSWVSLGYNFNGFYDRDFDAARYTQQGVYLKLRVKFDEKSLGLKKE